MRSGLVRGTWVVVFLCGVLCAAEAYTYNASDFATELVTYVEGTDVGSHWITGASYDNALAALDRPTVDTSGDGWFVPLSDVMPVVPVNPPSRAYEIVTIGNGGSLTVKFDHAVLDDPGNPYGLDLTIFSNAFQLGDGTSGWTNGDPDDFTAGSTALMTLANVSVSQDGVTWYGFDNDSMAGGYAPTLGRVYDTTNPDNSLGAWNLWWGEATDPTLLIDPSLSPADFDGKTVTQIAQVYGQSAGGTGFDIGALGLGWIQYVRVTDDPLNTATTEIDAFADVSAVPEPTSAALIAGGLTALAACRRRRRHKAGVRG